MCYALPVNMNEAYSKEVFPLLARLLAVDEVSSIHQAKSLIDRKIEEARLIREGVLRSQDSTGLIATGHDDPHRVKRQEIPAQIDSLVLDAADLKRRLEGDERRPEVSGSVQSPAIRSIVRSTAVVINALLSKANGISEELTSIGWNSTTPVGELED
jgi:hypothetical protein